MIYDNVYIVAGRIWRTVYAALQNIIVIRSQTEEFKQRKCKNTCLQQILSNELVSTNV